MRFSWLVLGSFGCLVACGGSVFTAGGPDAAGAAGLSDGGTSAGGRDGSAGKPSTPSGGAAHGAASSGGSADGGAVSGGAAHGGAASAGAATGGSSAGGAASAGAGGAFEASCPALPPVAGKACAPDLYCSYGDDPRPACRDRFRCTNGKWVAAHPAAGTCPPIADCAMTPSGFPVVGHECQTFGEECSFDGGASGTIYCRCNFCGAMSSCPASMAAWACAGPPIAPCPEALPNEGQPCEKKQSCFYGVPCEGVTMACDGKTWSTMSGGCAN
jgi:hypothetical protein